MNELLEQITENYNDVKLLTADGFDDAVIGIDTISMRLIYSKRKCVDILIESDGLSEEKALEYLDFNTFCAYVGEKTPIWCDDLF